MKKFQIKLYAEKFVTISAESEDALLKKIERMPTQELRGVCGLPEWDTDTVTEMPDEIEAELVLADGKLWTSN